MLQMIKLDRRRYIPCFGIHLAEQRINDKRQIIKNRETFLWQLWKCNSNIFWYNNASVHVNIRFKLIPNPISSDENLVNLTIPISICLKGELNNRYIEAAATFN